MFFTVSARVETKGTVRFFWFPQRAPFDNSGLVEIFSGGERKLPGGMEISLRICLKQIRKVGQNKKHRVSRRFAIPLGKRKQLAVSVIANC